jgi:hypothetical protein
MTLEQFYELLEKSPRRWVLINGKVLRYRRQRGGENLCPLTYAYMKKKKKYIGVCDFRKVAEILGLTVKIANAADVNSSHSREIRDKMFKACQPFSIT